MESISIYDGLILTIVSMLVVFAVLAAIWGLVELISRFVREPETVTESPGGRATPAKPQQVDPLASNKKHQQAVEMMALVLASEDEPNKKFEIVESKRIK